MDTLCKKLLWVALVLILGQHATAQENVSKTVTENFALTNSGKLQLENKYGNINLFGWDKEEVSVSIVISANHRKKENAKDLLKRISPVIKNSNNYVSIGYEIAEKNHSFFAKLFDEVHPDFDRSNVQIDYTVHLPKKAELKVMNTFGDVIIEDWSGQLKATIEHGDLWINNDLNKADIVMKYGKLRANSINYGSLDLKNGELDMEDSKNLRINSNGSEMALNSVKSLEIYSNKDDVTLAEVGTAFGHFKFTTVQISRLIKGIDLNLRIADLRVDEIVDPSADIAIEQESSKLSFNIVDFSHQFEATVEQGLVRLPKSFQNIDSKMLDKGKKLRRIMATYGNGKPGSISIKGKKGVVLLKEY